MFTACLLNSKMYYWIGRALAHTSHCLAQLSWEKGRSRFSQSSLHLKLAGGGKVCALSTSGKSENRLGLNPVPPLKHFGFDAAEGHTRHLIRLSEAL